MGGAKRSRSNRTPRRSRSRSNRAEAIGPQEVIGVQEVVGAEAIGAEAIGAEATGAEAMGATGAEAMAEATGADESRSTIGCLKWRSHAKCRNAEMPRFHINFRQRRIM